MNLSNLITVQDYALLHEMTNQGVTLAIRQGRLKAEKFGWQWVIRKGEKIKK